MGGLAAGVRNRVPRQRSSIQPTTVAAPSNRHAARGNKNVTPMSAGGKTARGSGLNPCSTYSP